MLFNSFCKWIDCIRLTAASQLAIDHKLSMPNQGDLLVDDRWLFEVGGKNKGFKQRMHKSVAAWMREEASKL